MTLFNPVECIGNQEVFDLRTAIVINLGSPVWVFALSWVCMLINSSPVEVGKTMCILGKMCRYPVKDDSDFLSVQIVYHVFKVLWSSITGSRCIVARYLIAPGAIKWMLCNSHQLHMGVTHFLHIGGQLLSCFPVIIKALFVVLCGRMLHPGAKMNFVNGHGVLCLIKFLPVPHPDGIFPFIISDICNPGCSSGSFLRLICIWICLEKVLPIHPHDKEFVQLSYLCTRHKYFKYANWASLGHGIRLLVPVIKFSDYRYKLCIWSPHCKIYAAFFPICRRMGT